MANFVDASLKTFIAIWADRWRSDGAMRRMEKMGFPQ
jgi:hypothetical protein